MFLGCTNLKSAASLNLKSEILTDACYFGMFTDCTSLEEPPVISAAITAARWSCEDMFRNCTALKTAPEINITNTAFQCFMNMFNGCSNLNQVSVKFTSWDEHTNDGTTSLCTEGWLSGVAAYGKLIAPDELPREYSESKIPSTWIVSDDINYLNPLTLIAEEDNLKIQLRRLPTDSSINIVETLPLTTLKYKLNTDNTWNDYENGNAAGRIITLNKGDSVQFINFNNTLSIDSVYVRFIVTESESAEPGKFQLKGNIQSLVNFSNTAPAYCFSRLFEKCTNLTTAKDLILGATTINEYSYYLMFSQCSNMIYGPTILAENADISSSESMFNKCFALKTAPQFLPVELKERCYYNMFASCSSLITGPTQIGISNSIAEEFCCANMFINCYALSNTPELPATTVSKSSYSSMFKNCKHLTNTIELPATTLGAYCYNSMFQNCINLHGKASDIPAEYIPDHACYCLYHSCSGITETPEILPATTLDTSAYAYMYNGCVKLTKAPQLPALNLGDSCYSSLFNGCINLTEAPELPATEPKFECYKKMFYGCSNLSSVSVNFSEWKEFTKDNETTLFTVNWLSSVAENGVFKCNTTLDTTIRDVSHIPVNWTVESAD